MRAQYKRKSSKSLDEVGADLEQAAERRGLGILAVVDLKQTMAGIGVHFDQACRIYEICKPERSTEIFKHSLGLSTVFPCRVSVYEQDGAVRVAVIFPSLLSGLFDVAEISWLARHIQDDLVAIINEAVADKTDAGTQNQDE